MSRRPIVLSPDLTRLQNEGYDLELRGEGGLLLVKDVPYVNAQRQVHRGTLIIKLTLAGNVAVKPADHVAYWSGEHPCHHDGRKITAFENPSPAQNLGDGVLADFMFSAKADYRDYHHKVTTYVGRITAEAQQLQPEASAQTFPAIPEDAEQSVFKFADTATSRAGIGTVNDRLKGHKIGIVGAGGTGAYVLDLVAKTPVAEIHLFDGDVFSQHNAFRAPGAATLERLLAKPQKVAYYESIYSNMRHGLFPHNVFLDETNIRLLDELDFVFLCLDNGTSKHLVVDRLISQSIPFVEAGMGIVLADNRLGGIVRIVASTASTREQAAPHISYSPNDGAVNEYATNIQVAELNALSAALAVIRWKKIMGVYQDTREHFYLGYSLTSGEIIGEGLK